jgi:hypothetical protein
VKISESFPAINDRELFLDKLYGGRPRKADIRDSNSFEEELRIYLLKAGGRVFIPEDNNAFSNTSCGIDDRN